MAVVLDPFGKEVGLGSHQLVSVRRIMQGKRERLVFVVICVHAQASCCLSRLCSMILKAYLCGFKYDFVSVSISCLLGN